MSQSATAQFLTAMLLFGTLWHVDAQTVLPASSVNAAQLVHRIVLGTDDLPDGPVTTLHVYMDLEQVPVLVLDHYRQLLKKPIAESRYRVSLDSGPLFKPSHARVAGDDPISLTILLDTNNPNRAVLNALPAAVAALTQPAPNQGFLLPHDRVSVYALGCTLIRSLNDSPADAESLQNGLEAVLSGWREDEARRPRDRKPCVHPAGLWDAIGYTTNQLHQLPGRRVLLVVTDGQNRGGKHRWSEALTLAQEDSVAIFGLMRPGDMEVVDNNRISDRLHRFSGIVPDHPASEDSFDVLCGSTGGMEFTSERALLKSLNWWMQVLRQRVIIEFPRFNVPGRHEIQVSVPKADLFIRIAGATVPLRDPKLRADPTTLPSDPSDTVPVGTRRPLPPPS